MTGFSPLRAIRFAGVGGLSTAVYWLFLLTLTLLLRFQPTIASIMAYLLGFGVSYLCHRNITYRSHAFIAPELARFLTMQAICFVLGNLVFWLVTAWLQLPVIAGGMALTLVSIGVSYVICEIWIFRPDADQR